MFEKIKNKKVLITGASSGIGACMAELFSSYGATVGIHYCRGYERAKKLRKMIKAKGGEVEIFKADLLKAKERAKLVSSFISVFKGIDILINNAGGIIGNKHFLNLDEKSWKETFSLNVEAPFFLARQAFIHMKKNKGGKIINISSIAAKYGGSTNSLHYGAAKGALESVTIGLSRAGAPYNILVNTIRGGFIDTPFHKKFKRPNIEARIKLIPLKRPGEPMDVSRMALFLASESGDFITGETFSVSGGD